MPNYKQDKVLISRLMSFS